jgi:trimethylamine--corrinoid protein Co-methyltransferase
MQFKTGVLSREEQERLHHQSLRLLDEVGVRFHSRKALSILEQAGARVDWEGKIARIPAELVDHALQVAPKSFVLGARNPAFDFPVPAASPRYCIDGTAAFTIDFETGERRYGRFSDIADAMRIFQHMDLGVMAWAPVSASDRPAPARALHEFFAMLQYCSKHGQHELHSPDQVPYLLEGLEAVMGGQDAVKARKNFSLIYCPVAPLTHDGPMLDAYLMLGEYELPVSVLPMPVSGSTGPAGLYSNVCVVNAENLSSLVIYQLAHPGRPVMYGSATGIVNFMTGDFLGGTPEMGLMSAAAVDMARFYGLPCMTAGLTSDANQPGAEAVMEKIISTIPAVLSGADIIVGYGEIQSDQALILEQIMVDNEIAHFLQRIYEGVDGDPRKDLFEDTAQVGPGGHFLNRRSTRLAARAGEFYHPSLQTRQSYESWVSRGRPEMYARAREKVLEILAGPLVDPLPEDVSARLDDILRKAGEQLTGEVDS